MARRIDLSGKFFGKLTVTGLHSEKTKDRKLRWVCVCECGTEKVVAGNNLSSGSTVSCGCFARKKSSERAKALFTKDKVKCLHPKCNKTKDTNGYCGMHYMRLRRYADLEYVTTEEKRVLKQRLSLLQGLKNKPKKTTYRKYYGKHEHRQIGEKMAGRKLETHEHVHHKDEDKHNNSIDNLEVMTNAEHARLHFTKKNKDEAS